MKAYKIIWNADEQPGVVVAVNITQAARAADEFTQSSTPLARATGGVRAIEEIGFAIEKVAK